VLVPSQIKLEQKDGVLTAIRDNEEHRGIARPGARAAGQRGSWRHPGLQEGLDIVGVGYRAELKGKMVAFALGKSAPHRVSDSRGHSDFGRKRQTHIVVKRRGQGQVGQVAAEFASLRPPDPYKQKGHPHHRRAFEEEGGARPARKQALRRSA